MRKGLAVGQLGQWEDEVRVFDEVVARFADAPEAGLRQQVADALFWKGLTLDQRGQFEEEVWVYNELMARFGDAPEAGLREKVATALVSKAVTLGKLGRAGEAARVCDEVVARFSDDPQPGVRRMVDLIPLTRKALENQLVRPSPATATTSVPLRQNVDHVHLPSAPRVPIHPSAPAITVSRLQALAEWASTPWRGVLRILKRR